MQALEATAQGLPIVTVNHQGPRALAPDAAGIQVPVTHPEVTAQALAKAIRGLYHSPKRRRARGEAGWEFAGTETWARRAERMSAVYEKAIAASGRRASRGGPGKAMLSPVTPGEGSAREDNAEAQDAPA